MERLDNPEAVVDRILARHGHDLRVALPLGLGKPVDLVNALTRRAVADPSISLQIFTALTLERTQPGSDMEKRFLEPALDRLFGRYPAIAYARMQHENSLPDNISVTEFFFQAPNWTGVAHAQQNYVSANYTHALDVLVSRKPNVVLQLLAAEDDALSLSCNTDITVDLIRHRRAGTADFSLIGMIHPELPFMPGSGEVAHEEVDMLVADEPPGHDLFSVVKQPISIEDQAIGLHASRLVRDGGTLQIGIGQVGDALANALILRHRGEMGAIWRDCPFYRSETFAETGPFDTGLYSVTEMLVDGLLALFEEGIIRREVEGAAIHAGFFLDSRDFYTRLRDLPREKRARIAMMPVSFTNSLYGDEAGRRAARRDARFVNSAMMVTAFGAAVSDGTEDGQVVSGVGGQFNFVEQAFALEDARAVITIPATRESKGEVTSNIVWNYGHITIPRHMRDIVVTQYGIADLRGKSDAEVIAALIAIADSRFQGALVKAAKGAGKLPQDYAIPDHARQNTPERLEAWLFPHTENLPAFPFGTDFTLVERRLLPALAKLKSASASRRELAALIWHGLRSVPVEGEDLAMRRMALDAPQGLSERLSALALRAALRVTHTRYKALFAP
ncbi:MAG: acetyl-CoA hydrolase/transferase C-terminal domain-containing protein [Salinarimonas sp.]